MIRGDALLPAAAEAGEAGCRSRRWFAYRVFAVAALAAAPQRLLTASAPAFYADWLASRVAVPVLGPSSVLLGYRRVAAGRQEATSGSS